MPGQKLSKPKNRYPVCQHVGIFVENLDKIRRFYVDRLGFTLERDYIADKKIVKQIFGINTFCRIQYLALNGFGIELFHFPQIRLSKRKAITSGTNHWNMVVTDKFSFCHALAKRKIKVIKVLKSNSTTFFIKDPEENLIEVKSYDDPGPIKKRY